MASVFRMKLFFFSMAYLLVPISAQLSGDNSTPDVPHRNPDIIGIQSEGPDSIVVHWKPVPQNEHNAPEFHYSLLWKRHYRSSGYERVDIADWQTAHYVLRSLEPHTEYLVKIASVNQLGEANVAPLTVKVMTGVGVPQKAPDNLHVKEIRDEETALISWDHVDGDSVQGPLVSYLVIHWNDSKNSKSCKPVLVPVNVSEALLEHLDPDSVNHALVYVYNGASWGPQSKTLSFTMSDRDGSDMVNGTSSASD